MHQNIDNILFAPSQVPIVENLICNLHQNKIGYYLYYRIFHNTRILSHNIGICTQNIIKLANNKSNISMAVG